MWYVIQGSVEGLEIIECDSYEDAMCKMLNQLAKMVEEHGVYTKDAVFVDRNEATLYAYSGNYELTIVEGKVGNHIK